ncbi:hypothetical protein ACFVVL_21430 [Kitasatospora sp. NPDC058115]|uniref:hypothetical protein n=1 Tax=Kitasatospora sp. NPDC058115 TaxID=3346347 RepID=UPI0036D85013
MHSTPARLFGERSEVVLAVAGATARETAARAMVAVTTARLRWFTGSSRSSDG